jgi:hypothetical protein
VDGGNAVDGVAPTTSGIAPGTPMQVQGPPVELGADDAADGVASSTSRIVPPEHFTIRGNPVGLANGSAPGRVATPGSRTEGRRRLSDLERGQVDIFVTQITSGLRARNASGNRQDDGWAFPDLSGSLYFCAVLRINLRIFEVADRLINQNIDDTFQHQTSRSKPFQIITTQSPP